MPKAIRCDNGPELCAQNFVDWCEEHGVEIRYIQPGKPNQNAYIERFNRTYREEVLNAYLFESLDDVRSITESWLQTADLQRDASSRRPRKDSAGDVSREDRGQNLYPRDVYLTGKLTH